MRTSERSENMYASIDMVADGLARKVGALGPVGLLEEGGGGEKRRELGRWGPTLQRAKISSNTPSPQLDHFRPPHLFAPRPCDPATLAPAPAPTLAPTLALTLTLTLPALRYPTLASQV